MLLPIFTKSVLIFTKSDVRYVTIEVSCPFETIQLKKIPIWKHSEGCRKYLQKLGIFRINDYFCAR
jgi:hypothetical protein